MQPSDLDLPRSPPARGTAVSARARALDLLIGSSLEALRADHRPEAHPAEALLFAGSWNDALPRLLIHDGVLEPVDKIVWAVIKTRADPGRGTAFPSYATIGRLANVGSEATVSRALAILRVTRWLTLCGRARDLRGRFRGNVYALHDEPLSLADTLYLDPAYLAFTYQAAQHRHARVAQVAGAIARSLELDLAEGADVLQATDPLVERVAAQQAIQEDQEDGVAGKATASRPKPPSVFGVRFRLRQKLAAPETIPDDHRLQNLKTVETAAAPRISGAIDQLQILKTVEPQNLREQNFLPPQNLEALVVVGGSSNQTTTTTTTESAAAGLDPVAALGRLRWPPALSANHRYIAAIQLRAVPAPLRQDVLDILDGRLRAAERGAERLVYGPIAYLKALCSRAIAGQLVLPSAAGAELGTNAQREAPTSAGPAIRLKAELRAARGDHVHWERLARLDSNPERSAPIRQLVEQALQEVRRIEGELRALDPRSGT